MEPALTSAWTTVTIGGKTADVFDPPGGPPRFGVLHLHGSSLKTLAASPRFTSELAARRLACVCPHGQHSWWSDRICTEFDPAVTAERWLLDQVLPFFHERWQLPERRVGLTGISMGGQGALRLAFKYPRRFPVVAAISSAIDYHDRYGQGTPLDRMYDSKEQCRQDTAILHVPPVDPPPHIWFGIDPEDTEWLRGNDRLHEKLTALGIPHECDLKTRAGGHTWDYFEHLAAPVLHFVHERLERESRRLL